MSWQEEGAVKKPDFPRWSFINDPHQLKYSHDVKKSSLSSSISSKNLHLIQTKLIPPVKIYFWLNCHFQTQEKHLKKHLKNNFFPKKQRQLHMKFPDLHQHEQLYNFRYIIIVKNRRKFSIKKTFLYTPKRQKSSKRTNKTVEWKNSVCEIFWEYNFSCFIYSSI